MKSARFRATKLALLSLLLLGLESKQAISQVPYVSAPAYVQQPVYQYAPARAVQPRYYVSRPAARYYRGRPGSSAVITRFRGGYVGGRGDYWPTGRNIPMAKPWLPPR